MAAAAGARRSDTAYPRLLEWSHATRGLDVGNCRDVSVSEATAMQPCTDAQAQEAFAQVRRLPFVESSALVGFPEIAPELPGQAQPSDSAIPVMVDVEGAIGRGVVRLKLLHGRLPGPTARDEAAIGLLIAERFHLSIGDRLSMYSTEAGSEGQPVDAVHIVGIYAAPGELPSANGPQSASFMLSEAFGQAHRDLIHPSDDGLALRPRAGTPAEEVEQAIRAIGFDIEDQTVLTSGIEKTIRVETIALVLLGLVVGSVGLVVVGQMLRRQTAAGGGESTMLSALGADRQDALRVGLLRGLVVGGVGAVLGAVVAIAMSPLFPVGIGRVADPAVGVHADGVVLAVGAAITLTLVVVLALVASSDNVRQRAREQYGARVSGRPWPLPASRPPVLVGLYLAVPRRSGTRPAARASLVSLVLVVIALAATAVTLASFDHLVARRDLAGATWQAVVVPPDDDSGPADISSAIDTVRRVPGVAAATRGTWATTGGGVASGVYVNGQRIGTQFFGDEGPIRPAIEHGRAPERSGEIALGAKTLAALGVRVGDRVRLTLDPKLPSIDGLVVGETVLASTVFFDFPPGIGAATVYSTLPALGTRLDPALDAILLSYGPGADGPRTFNAVERALGTQAGFEVADRQSVSGLGRIRLVPVLLLIGLLALVAAAVAHVLLVTVTDHRREVAVLRAIGFTGPQSWTSVTVHAALIVLVACAVGLPLGVLAGRAAWTRIADSLYVVSRPMAPVEMLVLICIVLLAVAIAASLVPAARAVRLKPARVLRAD
jgi:ABC-type lipoprotein release transport system permease subunit